jgi:tetratricopeptide (TPR) repeat protein
MTRENLHLRCALLPLMLAFIGADVRAAEAPPRPASQQEYWFQFDRKDWDAAVKEAQRLVEVTRLAKPFEPLRLADVLAMLGDAQLAKGNYVEAEKAFAEALELVEQHSTPTSPNLLTPLRGLGYTLAAAGNHDQAVPLLERALLITHRSHGLFDIGQQGILRQLAVSLTRSGRIVEASKHMSYLLRVGQRAFGSNDPRLIPFLNIVADWHSDIGNFGTSRQLYVTALKISEQKLGANHLSAVEPLRGLARTFTQELHYATFGLLPQPERPSMVTDFNRESARPIKPRHLSDDGRKALQRAIDILEANPERPAGALANALIQMGDWHQIRQETEKARAFYQRAWLVDETETSGRARLSFPEQLYYPMPSSAVRARYLRPDESDERFVQIEFTVTSEGTVKDARVVETNASQRQASDALEAIRDSLYRPKFVEGAPVETTALTYREVFRTRKKSGDRSDEEEARDSAGT